MLWNKVLGFTAWVRGIEAFLDIVPLTKNLNLNPETLKESEAPEPAKLQS